MDWLIDFVILRRIRILRGVIINAKSFDGSIDILYNIFNLNPAENVAIHSHLISVTDKIEMERWNRDIERRAKRHDRERSR